MLGRDLAAHTCLPFSFLEGTLKFLADEGYISTTGVRMTSLAHGESLNAGMEHQISGTGRQKARELMELNQYAGPGARCPISEYSAMAEQQAAVDGVVNRARLHDAFSNLVLSESVLDHLGPALSAREAIFLHGPPGNGKTTIAEAAASLMGPPVFVPRALYVHGEIIRFFDPIYHVAIDRELPAHDRRWQLVQRPAVKVGGELTPRMLELSYDPTLGFYEASMQLKANGGLFLIDDFGRQQNMSPRDLLNRLIVPLEKRVDYANISRAGTTVAVPVHLPAHPLDQHAPAEPHGRGLPAARALQGARARSHRGRVPGDLAAALHARGAAHRGGRAQPPHPAPLHGQGPRRCTGRTRATCSTTSSTRRGTSAGRWR